MNLYDLDQTGATIVVVHDGETYEIEAADLEWLLAQPDLPNEFRRAAAVHLEQRDQN